MTATLALNEVARATPEEIEVDHALARRAAGGDRRAFEILVRKYQRTVFHIALAVLKDADAALDAAQDAFVRLHSRLGTFRGEAPFKAWLSRLALHVALDQRRRLLRQPERPVEALQLARAEDCAERVDRTMERDEVKERVQAALARLNETQRTILTLREMEGLAYAQIAKVMRIPVGTVMSRLFYARRALKAQLEALAAQRGEEVVRAD